MVSACHCECARKPSPKTLEKKLNLAQKVLFACVVQRDLGTFGRGKNQIQCYDVRLQRLVEYNIDKCGYTVLSARLLFSPRRH